MSRAEEMLPSNRYNENNQRKDYSHSSTYYENGEQYWDDHISGVDWHRPKRSSRDSNSQSDDAWLNELG